MNLDWLSDLTGWISPAQRAKVKRAKLEALKEEREKLLKGKCTAQMVIRMQKIDAEIAIIDRDLRS